MKQGELLDAVVDAIRTKYPDLQTRGEYLVRYDSESGTIEVVTIQVVPAKTRWARRSKNRNGHTHDIDVLFFGMIDTPSETRRYQDMLEEMANWFLTDAGPIESALAQSVETVDGAPAGYDPDALRATPMVYFGGIRITFITS